MPAVLSKSLADWLLGGDWSFGYNCYEVGHTWTPSCTEAALEVSLAAAGRVLPLYTLLYGSAQLATKKRLGLANTWDTLKSVARSSAFIFFHIYTGSILGCALRNGLGRFYYRVLVCLPALAASYLALLIEKPSRRQALAFYVLNLATEIVYRMALTKHQFKPLPHGETFLFALSLSAWYYLIKAHGFGHDPVSSAVSRLIGRHEAHEGPRKTRQPVPGRKTGPTRLPREASWLADTWLGGRHATCPHQDQHATCLSYVTQPMPSRFLMGCLAQALLRLSARPLELLGDPVGATSRAILNADSARSGLFLVSLVSGGRLASCILRRYSNSNEPHWHGLVAGLAAGSAMFWSPRASLSMYIMWKTIEQYYLLAASQGKIACFDFSILTIYALSAATVLYTFALEPSLMRPSYMKFLDNISNHRLHQLNRMVLDVFGTGSSIGYEDYFPDLHPKLMSNQFKELVFNWMIQPYD